MMTIRITPGLLTTLLLMAATPGRAQFVEECATVPTAIAELLGPTQALCTGHTQGLLSSEESAGTLLIDDQQAFRALISGRGEKAIVFQGALAHQGSIDDTIFWGAWMAGAITEFDGDRASRRENRGATPFVAGVDPGLFFRKDVFSGRVRSPLPTTGIFDYRLLGRPVIVSDGNATRVQADNDGRPIDPGPIEQATVRVDFGTGVGAADLIFAVRGIRTTLRIPLLRRSTTTPFEENHGDDVPSHLASSAQVRFYGRQGEFMGLEIRVPYQGVPAHEAFARARLANARGHAVIALQRVDPP